MSAIPYWRLSNFYFFYFALLGALIPYWSLYLQHLGYSASEIGELVAILSATKVVAPNIWGWIADQYGRRMSIVRLASLCSALCFAGVYWVTDYWPLALVMSLFSFFWNASLPQFEATTMNYLGNDTHQYSIIRLWGSIGFIIAVWGMGFLIEQYGAAILLNVLLGIFVFIWLASLWVPERAAAHKPISHEPLLKVLKQPAVFSLLLACFLMQFSHGPYYTFYSIYLQDYGYSKNVIGFLWAFGVLSEVIVFIFMQKLLPRFGTRKLLLSSFLFAALRWCLIAWFPENVLVLGLAQVLHAASFGVFHVVTIFLIHQFFVGRNQGTGQALYSSISFGAGGALGSYYAGHLWESMSPSFVYVSAAGFALIAFILAFWQIRPIEKLTSDANLPINP